VLALFDGDVLAYHACRSRYASEPIELDSEGNRIYKEFTVDQNADYLFQSYINFKEDLERHKEALFTDQHLLAIKGSSNYRDLYFEEYKAPRHQRAAKTITPEIVREIRKLALVDEMAVAAEGCEADDLLRIWAEEARAVGDPYVICSVDKDLKCIPGLHYNLKSKEVEEISEWDATRFFYEQLLMGDSSDNIPGIPGIGPVKAKKILSGCIDEEELQVMVVEKYIDVFDDEWREYLLTNGKLLYIQKKPKDYFTISHWPFVRMLDGTK